jgi:acetolactate synthase-1/2/3 large subunit
MKKTGAWLSRYALEQLNISHTFGIPGVHNTELYDELNKSDKITPILVSHEGNGAFMADAISRTSEAIGAMLIVPAAGVAYAAPGIGEAFLDGIPMLVICGGIRTDLDYEYQLHDINQQDFIKPFCKGTWKVLDHEQVIPSIYEAYNCAISGEPGPVFVEIPVNIQLFSKEVSDLPLYTPPSNQNTFDSSQINDIVKLLTLAKHPGIFAGWGAVNASNELIALSVKLNAPVATTLQGLSVFPSSHPLHAGFGFGPAAVPAARDAFKDCDVMLAVGTRFGEIGTGSFGAVPPEKLIHIDINPEVLGANFPTAISLCADASEALKAINKQLPSADNNLDNSVTTRIAKYKKEYADEWNKHTFEKVNPLSFFEALKNKLDDDSIIVVDDGNHTYLTAELMPIEKPASFISPTDFNCMGYSIPAAIGAKFANPNKNVVAILGDGCFRMTCMEILTAVQNHLGMVYFVFDDGELSQIAQAQEIPYNRKPCTGLSGINYEGISMGLGADYYLIDKNSNIQQTIHLALAAAKENKPVIVRVDIDYSKKTAFTLGAVKTNFARFDGKTKVRFVARSVKRKIFG